MTVRVALVCNGLPPGCGLPNGAQGLRSHGLREGLAAHGVAADILTRASVLREQQDRWGSAVVRFRAGWRVVPDQGIATVLARDYSHVVFSNWGGVGDYRRVDGVRMIYDVFSATMVEHAFICDAAELTQRRRRKDDALAMADRFIANGTGRAAYAIDYLRTAAGVGRDEAVPSVRLALPWMGVPRTGREGPLRVFFGGFEQAWTVGPTLPMIADLAARLGIEVHVMGAGQRLHGERGAAAGEAVAPGLVLHRVAPFERFCAVARACDVAVDVFEENDERRLSYSTRAVTALANGVPVLTMGFTEIGRLVEGTGAGWCLDRFDAAALAARLAALRDDRAAVAAAQEATRRFWTECANPAREAAALVEILD